MSFQKLIDAKRHGQISIAGAYAKFTRNFPQPVEAKENSWFCQPMFSNTNIKTKVPNRRGRGFKMVSQTYLNLPPNTTININELYVGGRFIDETKLENLLRLHGNINYRI